MYSIGNNLFIALVAISFGRYDPHEAKATQNLKMLVIFSAYNAKLYGNPFCINVNIYQTKIFATL